MAWRAYHCIDPMTREQALDALREDTEGMSYHPHAPIVWLHGGGHMECHLDRAPDGSVLLGVWGAWEYDAEGNELGVVWL